MDEQLFEMIMDKFKTLETKVDDVIKFKWQIMGGTAVVSIIVGIIFQILIAKYGK